MYGFRAIFIDGNIFSDRGKSCSMFEINKNRTATQMQLPSQLILFIVVDCSPLFRPEFICCILQFIFISDPSWLIKSSSNVFFVQVKENAARTNSL